MTEGETGMNAMAIDSGRPSGPPGEEVISIIAEVTRYPREILTPEARLEDDLGIDSVKRAEIVTVLLSRFGLTADEDALATLQLQTVGDVVSEMAARAGAAPAPAIQPAPERPTAAPAGPSLPAGPSPASGNHAPANDIFNGIFEEVVAVIAGVTGHPEELLESEADLEHDLGVDQASRRRISEAIRERLKLPGSASLVPLGARTMADIVRAVEGLRARPEPALAPAPVLTPTRAQAPSTVKLLEGKIALVTGSGRGLGKVIARQLAGLGATVVVNSFHSRASGEGTAEQIVKEGGKAVHIWGSVANTDHLKRLFDEINSRFRGLDFLVSNASNGILARLEDVTPEHWELAFRTNVIALHQASMLASELMRRRGGGRIVAISSNGSGRYHDYFGCLGPVKAAMESLVSYLAVELGGEGIQVNAVSAGPVYGELLDKYPDRDKLVPLLESMVPRGRLNDEQEVSDTVLFLLTNTGMNGSVLKLDAGGGQRINPPV